LIAAMTAEVSRSLIDHLAPQAEERLLDIACGAGDPALGLLEAVSGQARLVALDPVEDLAGATRAAARDAGVVGLAATCARVEQLPFGEACFDAASCRFGAMFFRPVEAGLAELRRVLRPAGRVTLAVWGPKEANPYFTAVARALDAAGVVAPPADPGQPTVFELAAPGDLAARLTAAGFSDAVTHQLPFEMALTGANAANFMQRQAELSPAIARRLDAASTAQRERAAAAAAETVAPWERDGAVVLPALALVLSARR